MKGLLPSNLHSGKYSEMCSESKRILQMGWNCWWQRRGNIPLMQRKASVRMCANTREHSHTHSSLTWLNINQKNPTKKSSSLTNQQVWKTPFCENSQTHNAITTRHNSPCSKVYNTCSMAHKMNFLQYPPHFSLWDLITARGRVLLNYFNFVL